MRNGYQPGSAELKGMKAKQIISLMVGITSVALSPITRAAGHGGGGGFAGGGGGFHGGGFSGVGHAAGGVGARGGGVGFGGMRGGGFRAAPYRYGALILPAEVSADQPVRSDTTTETAARLLLGHTNSADGETNR